MKKNKISARKTSIEPKLRNLSGDKLISTKKRDYIKRERYLRMMKNVPELIQENIERPEVKSFDFSAPGTMSIFSPQS